MKRQHRSRGYVAYFLMFFLSFSFPDAHAKLVVSPVGPTQVNAVAGRNVTLNVSSNALDPTVTWCMGPLPVVTWTVGSDASPDIPNNITHFLKVESNGALTFLNVPVNFTNSYKVSMTKSGLGTGSANFDLRVFEIFRNVTLKPSFGIEGSPNFTLYYVMEQGVVNEETWLFNGQEIEIGDKYSLGQQSLVIKKFNRGDTGEYSLQLTNPFSTVMVHKNFTVLYGPDEPSLKVVPAQEFYVTGDPLNLSCQADGSPKPTVTWNFNGQSLPDVHEEVLNLTNVQTSQGGIYTCMLLNEQTQAHVQKSITVTIYERPPGSPVCHVKSDNNVDLQYHCQWSGGTPQTQLSFPALSNTSEGEGNLSLTITPSENLNGKTVTCVAEHPVEKRQCSVTAKSPSKFLPTVRTTVDRDGKIVVSICCLTDAAPAAMVSWFTGDKAINNATMYQLNSNNTQLNIRNYNVSTFLQQDYNCTCSNLLGTRSRQIHLQGPSISDSGLFPNRNGTVITLTWEVPRYSIVTGFDIQMKGPDLPSKRRNGTQSRDDSGKYSVIQQKPGSARSADVYPLNPKSRYWFRVIPRARMAEGEPSAVHRAGPAEGLSGPAIAGIAAGIPCSILFLLLLCGLIYLCINSSKNRSRQARYPMSRAVEKAVATQPDPVPHKLLVGGLKLPPDYNRLQHTPSERSVDLPRFVPSPPPVRVATTV